MLHRTERNRRWLCLCICMQHSSPLSCESRRDETRQLTLGSALSVPTFARISNSRLHSSAFAWFHSNFECNLDNILSPVMDYCSGDSDDCDSDSEIKEYEEKCLADLKAGVLNARNADGTLRCPFCTGKKKQDYKYKELLQHATGAGAGKRGEEATGSHRALEKFLKTDLQDAAEPPVQRVIHLEQDTPERQNTEELIVWPWMGIITNIGRTWSNGRYVGAGNSELRERFSKFCPVHVHALWNYEGHSGKAVVEFSKDWKGYSDALSFERSFVASRRGRKEFYEGNLGTELYGWVARAEDYNSKCPIGKHLRAKGNLKTVADIDAEEIRKKEKLVEDLNNTIQEKTKRLETSKEQVSVLEYQIHLTESARQKAEAEKRTLEEMHRAELKKFEEDRVALISCQNEELLRKNKNLAHQMTILESRRKDLEKREAQTELEKKKLEEDRKEVYDRQENLERANEVHKQCEEEQRKLIEKHGRENRDLIINLHELKKKLAEKQKLELEIQGIQSHLQAMKHVEEASDNPENSEHQDQLKIMESKLKEKNDELEILQDTTKHLISKERLVNQELQDARKTAIRLLEDPSDRRTLPPPVVIVKRMGDISQEPWVRACRKKFAADEWELQCSELYSKWQDYLRDPSWHPFKVQSDNETCEYVLDDNDEKLQQLKNSMGEEVCNSVVVALKELNEYNASGRYCVPELWNQKENRRATLSEAIEFLIKPKAANKKRRL